MNPVVAVLGTATMGAGMVRSLRRAGLPVRMWNRDAARARALTDTGAEASDSPAEAVAGADVVLTVLLDADAVLDAVRQASPAAARCGCRARPWGSRAPTRRSPQPGAGPGAGRLPGARHEGAGRAGGAGAARLGPGGGAVAAVPGRIVNPRTARSQFIGGMTMGLHETSVWDARIGQVANHDLAEYHITVNADVGDVQAHWLDEHDPYVNVMGTKGIGEIGITGTAAAVVNAVHRATGVRVRDLPVTLDKVLSGLP